jgi:multiple sugar transport system substrate-binding protein
VLYYNTDIFKAAGIDKVPTSWATPWTWDEFAAVVPKLAKKDANGKPTQYAMGFPTNIVSPIAYGAGGSFTDPDETKCMMNDPVVVNELDKWVKWVLPGGPEYFMPPSMTLLEMWNAGKLAIMWTSMDAVAQISKTINYDIMPMMKTTKYAYTENYDRTFVISKSAKEPEAAFVGLMTLCLPPVIDVYSKAKFGVPYYKAAAQGPIFNDASQAPAHKNVWIETFQEFDGHLIDIPTPRSPSMEDNKNTFVEAASGAGSLFTGQMTTKQFFDQGCDKANKSVAQYNWKKGELEKRLVAAGAVKCVGTKIEPKTFNT